MVRSWHLSHKAQHFLKKACYDVCKFSGAQSEARGKAQGVWHGPATKKEKNVCQVYTYTHTLAGSSLPVKQQAETHIYTKEGCPSCKPAPSAEIYNLLFFTAEGWLTLSATWGHGGYKSHGTLSCSFHCYERRNEQQTRGKMQNQWQHKNRGRSIYCVKNYIICDLVQCFLTGFASEFYSGH